MATVAILTILVIIGVPTFTSVIVRNRVATHTNDFLTALNHARSEALTRGRRAVLCKSSNGTSCAAADSGDWEQGWITFVDLDNTNTFTTGDTLIRVHGPLDANETLIGNTNVKTYIAYSPSGYLQSLNGTLSLCVNGSSLKNAIVISSVGRARTDEGVASCP
jgi:type IV fimbrial biogenesis protein FimT